tara:strand:- start:2388 stop:2786 length:399 start_codon:yes stop_codon:yes gene_type:complete
MYTHITKLRVRYSDTDQMKYAYYGVYAKYLEIGRVELLRSIGISYKQIEELGFGLPVVNLKINYRKPAFYDDLLTIETTIKKINNVKLIFKYKIYNEQDELLNTAETTLVFINIETRKICIPPNLIFNKLQK